ncbi:MAG: hypothetical protein CME70_18865 [Halobacteriovorax sp.]|nr:hypothetical protein [Halobacteriovorax sp.]
MPPPRDKKRVKPVIGHFVRLPFKHWGKTNQPPAYGLVIDTVGIHLTVLRGYDNAVVPGVRRDSVDIVE